MNPRHAAALVMVGWYLMVPPPFGPVIPETPLTQWTKWKTFDTAAKCEAARDQEVADSQKTLKDASASAAKKIVAWEFSSVQCVATDDPRLKSK